MAPRERGLMNLLERSTELAVLKDKLAEVRVSGGSLVLVAGEAGIGKTALLDAFCDGSRGVPTVRGGCDALFTPRPLGPFVEIAEDLGGELACGIAGALADAGRLAPGRRPATSSAPGNSAVERDHEPANASLLHGQQQLARRDLRLGKPGIARFHGVVPLSLLKHAQLVVGRLRAIGLRDRFLAVKRTDRDAAKLHLSGVVETLEHGAPVAGPYACIEAVDVFVQQLVQNAADSTGPGPSATARTARPRPSRHDGDRPCA